MTLAEAEAKIKELEAQAVIANASISEANTKISKLNTESAERRVLNNQQKRQLHATKQVIAKNNIKVDYDALGTDSLTLNKDTGAVEGDVTYNPASTPNVGSGIIPASNGAPEAMSIESIQGMSRADIAKNWDKITSVLEAQTPQQSNTI